MMNTILITTDYNPHGKNTQEEWSYRLREGTWEVQGPDDDEWEEYADGQAGERTVRQLLRKDHDVQY